MGIVRFFDKKIYIQRYTGTSGYKKALTTTATADGSIQMSDNVAKQTLGIVQGRSFLGFFNVDKDIQEGDILIDSDTSDRFVVREVTKHEFGINQHLEVVMEEYNA